MQFVLLPLMLPYLVRGACKCEGVDCARKGGCVLPPMEPYLVRWRPGEISTQMDQNYRGWGWEKGSGSMQHVLPLVDPYLVRDACEE